MHENKVPGKSKKVKLSNNPNHESQISAKDRAKQYHSEFYELGSRLYCRYCSVVVNHVRRSTVENHRKSSKHVSSREEFMKRRSGPGLASLVPGDVATATASHSVQSALATHVRQTGVAECFKKATVHQEAKQEIIQDLMRALVASDIAFEKMDNPVMREFLKKHVTNGGAIPGANGLRLHLRTVYDAHRSDLTEIFHQHKTFSVVADETTDAVGRCVLNILLIPDLSPSENNESLRPYLIESILLEAVNNSTVGGAIIRALVNYNIAFHSISAFVSDNAAYMKKAFRDVMSPLLSNAVHVTCWAHIMSLLGDEWRKNFHSVDRFVAKMKAIFVFSSRRRNAYRSFMLSRGVENPKMPPQPVITRWNSWLAAVQQHDEYFSHYPALIDKLIDDGNSSADLMELKEMLKQPGRSTLFCQIKSISLMCAPIKNVLVQFESREIQIHRVFSKVQEIDAWLSLRLQKNFVGEFASTLRQELPAKAAQETVALFQQALGSIRNKLTTYLSGGAQPAMNFFRSVRLLDPQQHAAQNTDFGCVQLPHVASDDLQIAQEWQQFLNISSDSATAVNSNIVAFWRSLTPILPTLAPAALAALSVPPASVDAERSFSIYKSIFSDNRQSLTMENMSMLLMLKFNASNGGLLGLYL